MASYAVQSELVIDMLPIVDQIKVFALKGGTAINYFYLDMPRLSVDIDLCYLPVADRITSLTGISDGLQAIKQQSERIYPNIRVVTKSAEQGHVTSLLVQRKEASVKIEPNLVIRGSVFSPERRPLSQYAAESYGRHAVVTVLSEADIYGGKICAALDRQHPRDLFDIWMLLEGSGLTENIRQAFIVYLISHSRPMAELLAPNRLDIAAVYANEFLGMVRIPVDLNRLLEAREQLIAQIHSALTQQERSFILSIKRGEPQWNLFPLKGIEKLPAVKWKLKNIQQMTTSKHLDAIEKLEKILKL
jgi:predicted nucleotidyltransferase component of viral defense system